MTRPFTEARKRQLARLRGAKPPAARAAIALAKSQAYQDAADAPTTLRAYATDLANYKAWCDKHGFIAMPATPEVVGAYLAAAGEGYAMPTLRRRHCPRVWRCRPPARHQASRDPRDTSRNRPEAWQSAAASRRSHDNRGPEAEPVLWYAGARDRALILLGFAGALRRSELVGLDMEHVTWTDDGLRLLVERSKTDQQGEGAEMGHTRHRSLTTMRSYVRRAKLSQASPAGKLGL
jgi:integrase